LSQYAPHIGLVLVALITALAAWAILHKRRTVQRGDEIHTEPRNVEPAVADLQPELRHAIETAQATAGTAVAVGDKVIAAVRPIEAALRDLSGRLSKLEQRADANDALSADLKSSLRAQEGAARENARVVEGINVRLGEFEHQLIAVSDQLSGLKQMIEAMKARNGENSEPLRTIDTNLAVIRSQMDDLSQRLDSGQRSLADLSTKTVSIEELVASLKSTSQQAEQKLADLERRLPSGPTGREQAVQNVPPTDLDGGLKDKDEDESSDVGDQTGADDRGPEGDDGNEQTDDANCGHRRALEGRGGRPRGDSDATDQHGQPVEKVLRPRSQVVVTRGSGDWDIFVEVEPIDSSNLRVMQGSDALHERAERSLFGPLRDLTTPIRILSGDDEVGEVALITQKAPLLFFRLQRDIGWSVRRPSRGLNLAVVPVAWRYDVVKSGAPPIELELMGIQGYRAHFFSADTNPILAFDRPDEAPFEIDCTKPEFRLEGRELPDAYEQMGPLFGADLPTLEGAPGAMAKVRTVVLGAEGRGSGRWRDEYQLNAERWRLPEDVRTQGSGWYFIRLYDAKDDLIDSFDFRYAAGLKGIDVEGAGLTQDHNGIRVTFVHDEGVSVVMTASILSVLEHSTVPGPGSTIFAWPWHPDVRRPTFEVRDRNGLVRVTLDTDRICWALANEPQALEPAWQSSAIELTPGHCSPGSDAQLLVRFPHSAEVDAFIGFSRADRRKIQIAADQASVHLHGFSEAPELTRIGRQSLNLWICTDGPEVELDIAHVSVSMKCPWCEARMVEQEEMISHLLSRHHDNCFERLDLRGEELGRVFS
jgi:hypothetical protein